MFLKEHKNIFSEITRGEFRTARKHKLPRAALISRLLQNIMTFYIFPKKII